MSYLPREVDTLLNQWKKAKTRKPLILRGARQVGKTASVREFGKDFKNIFEVNFLEDNRAAKVFNGEDLDPFRITRELSALYSKEIVDGNTLLFLDEIQSCSRAIESLRFFYEKRPNLHVIAAGSLLEFALTDLPSFGVGRIESIFMRPLNFREFLRASDKERLLEEISSADHKHPMPPVLHEETLSIMRNFTLMGGTPAVVSRFIETGSFLEIGPLLDDLRQNYEDDFSKYSGRIPTIRLRDTLRSIAQQTGKKFVYSHAYVDAVTSQVNQALKLLEMAGLAYKVVHSSANGIPIGAESNPAKFKALIHDLGLFHNLLGAPLRQMVAEPAPQLIHRGAIAEVIVGLELLSYSSERTKGDLWYWHREAKSSSAEVDYLVQIGTQIFPIEVKANTKGSMKSLRSFMAEKKSPSGFRISSENFGKYDDILVVPIYAVSELERLVRPRSESIKELINAGRKY